MLEDFNSFTIIFQLNFTVTISVTKINLIIINLTRVLVVVILLELKFVSTGMGHSLLNLTANCAFLNS